jgi:DNA-binding SARP family transcriptional activator
VEFRILGPVEVADDDRRLEIGGGRQTALLALLLLHANEPVSVDVIVDELWNGRPPARPAKSVQVHVSRLRAALGRSRVASHPRGYAIRVEEGELDAHRFAAAVERGRTALATGDASTAASVLREALAMWRGPPLADVQYESFAQRDIARLEELRVAVVEDRCDADLVLGRQREVVAELEGLVAAHPLRERLRGQLMVALHRCGRQAEALEAYREGRLALAQEGLAPSRTLEALERAVLEDDRPAAEPPPVQRVAAAPRRWKAAVVASLVVAAAAVAAALVGRSGGGAAARAGAPDEVVAIDVATGRLVATAHVGRGPVALAYGGGSVWAANGGEASLTRIDARSGKTVRTIPLRGVAGEVVYRHGVVWVARSRPPARIDRLDPTTNEIVATATLPHGIFRVTGATVRDLAASETDVWAATSIGVYRLGDDGRARRVTTDIGLESAVLAVGANAVWVVSSGSDAAGEISFTVTRVDRSGSAVSVPLEANAGRAALASGSLWLTVPGQRRLLRIDPRSLAPAATIVLPGEPVSLATGLGAMWAGLRDGRLVRVDPHSGDVVTTIRFGATPTAIAAGAGRLWVALA